eukprot:scaffold305_cov247-Pinguiococcus_pyrenoidosus.AAC.18
MLHEGTEEAFQIWSEMLGMSGYCIASRQPEEDQRRQPRSTPREIEASEFRMGQKVRRRASQEKKAPSKA